jgi:hypothetical protein
LLGSRCRLGELRYFLRNLKVGDIITLFSQECDGFSDRNILLSVLNLSYVIRRVGMRPITVVGKKNIPESCP